MHAKFQPSSFNGVGVGEGGRWKDGKGTSRHFANFHPSFLSGGISNSAQQVFTKAFFSKLAK